MRHRPRCSGSGPRARSGRRRRAQGRRLKRSHGVSSWSEFVTHVPGLFCYRCPRPYKLFAERDEFPRPLHVLVELIKSRLHRWSAQ